MLQIIFVFVNVGLVEAHLPGPLWFVIGAIFWIALIGLALSGSSLVCGTMCWVGALQDFAEPLARSRVRIDARMGRAVTFGLLLAWIPIGWYFWPSVALHDRTPLDLDPASWQQHLFGVGLALAIPLSVTILGKRGICRFLCPFNSVVNAVRRVARPMKKSSLVAAQPCAKGRTSVCNGCDRAPHYPAGGNHS